MKHNYAFRKLLLASFLGISGAVSGQVQHPLSFGYIGTDSANWYRNYVGVRLEVTSPAVISGDKLYSVATVADGWSSMLPVTSPIINQPIAMGPSGDTTACSGLAGGSMTGKVALIYRGTCEFGYKALQAQAAGAIACIIVNNVPGGLPVGMGAGSSGASVHIPTFMISNADGLAISGQYAGGTGTVKVTITPWGINNQNDLGFFHGGVALWHDYAVPSSQLSATTGVIPYMGVDGAFIANFGTNPATNVRIAGKATFIHDDGSTIALHSDTTAVLPTFNAIDSIYAFFGPQYNFTVPGNGRINVKYSIVSDSSLQDQFQGDDTTSYTFYTTDSLYSKGRYDFTNNRPIANLYEAAGLQAGNDHYIWGNMYYVNAGGTYANQVQWTISSNTDTGAHISSITVPMNVYLFKWSDGVISNDSFVENGELQLVGVGMKDFTKTPFLAGDTSGGVFTVTLGTDSTNGALPQPALSASTWYYVAVEVPSGWFLGCDGILDAYPRTYGRNHFDSYLEYCSPVWASDRYNGTNSMINSAGSALAPCPFGGSFNTDSVVFSTQKGMIPAVPFTTTTHPYVPPANNGVKGVSQAFASLEVYPNPASDYINVSLALDHSARVVTYTIIDGLARVISKEVHNNVQNDKYTVSTAKLPSGNYYMVVNADDKVTFRKFTVVR